MFCTKCGAQIPDESEFCPYCGAKAVSVQPAAEPAVQPEAGPEKSGFSKHRKWLLFEGIGTIVAAILIILFVLHPFGDNGNQLTSPRKAVTTSKTKQTAGKTVTPTPTKAPVKPVTEEPTRVITPAATDSPTPSPTPIEAQDLRDPGKSFVMQNGILLVNNDIFGMTYGELDRYFGYQLPSKQNWEWSSVPLEYLDYVYTDGNNYVLYFENDCLIAVRSERVIPNYSIPNALLINAENAMGEYDYSWRDSNSGVIYEYDWYCFIGDGYGEYAIFLNPYDDIDHVVQQYTSPAFTGGSIQNR